MFFQCFSFGSMLLLKLLFLWITIQKFAQLMWPLLKLGMHIPYLGFLVDTASKESACQCKRHGFNPWVGKMLWRRKWQPLQYSCLENSMDREVWQATVRGVAKSWTQLSRHFFLTYFFAKLLITCTIYIWIPLLPLFYFYKNGIVHITNFS